MEENKPSKKKQLWRNISLLLVVAIIITTIASYLATGASIVAQEEVVDAYTAAEKYLAENTDYVQQNRLDRAKTRLKQLFSGFSEEMSAHYDAMNIAIANEEYEKALKEADACLKLMDETHTQYIELLTKKGCLEALLEKYDDAKATFEKVISLNEDMPEAHLLLAELCLESEDIAKATEHLVKYTELNPEDISQLPVIAELYYGQNNYQRAITYAEKAIASGSTVDMDLMNALALSQLLTGNYRDAVGNLTKAIDIGLQDATASQTEKVYAIAGLGETFYYRGLCYLTLASFSDAVPDYNNAIALGYETSLVYYNRGVCLLQMEAYQECYDDMKKVIEYNDEPELVEIAQTLVDAIDSAIADAQTQADSAAAAAQKAQLAAPDAAAAAGTTQAPAAENTAPAEQKAPAAQNAAPAAQNAAPAAGGPENAPAVNGPENAPEVSGTPAPAGEVQLQ